MTLRYKLTVLDARGICTGQEWHDEPAMREELAAIARILDAMVIGETISITRLPDEVTEPTPLQLAASAQQWRLTS